MSNDSTKLSRQALYDMVWTTPMQALAKNFGLSDVGLAKICRKHDIPRPPRGYWARLQYGQKIRKPPLPDPGSDVTIVIERRPPVEPGEARATIVVKVLKTLQNPHPLVRKTDEILSRKQPSIGSPLIRPTDECLAVHVGPKSLHRALCIMDALLKAAEARGFQIRTSQNDTYAGPPDVEIGFRLYEEVENVPEEPSERSLEGRYQFSHSSLWKTQRATGRLRILITHGYCGRVPVRINWRDGKRQSLEDLLGEFTGELLRIVEIRRAQILEEQKREQERQRRQKEREAAERRRLERLAEIEAEEARVEELIEESENWMRSRHLRRYVAARTRDEANRHGGLQPGGEFDAWRKWALEQADRLDPLRESPPSIVDEKAKYSKPEPPDSYFTSW